MIRPELTDDIVDRFQLWREFLLLSENYKKLCLFIETKKEEHPWRDPIIKLWSPVEKTFDRPYFYWLRDAISENEYDQIYDEESGTTFGMILESLYPLFQNVYANDFNDVKERIQVFYQRADFESISLISPALNNILHILTTHPMYHTSRRNEHVCAGDLFQSLIEHFQNNVGKFNLISVNPNNFGYGEGLLLKEFKQYLSSHDYKPFHPKIVPHRWEPFIPATPYSKPKMQARLSAIKSKQAGLSRSQAIEKLFPNDSRDERIKEGNYDTYIRQAYKIIKNAELGDFPGDYGK